MDQVRFAGSAGLPFMMFEREFVGFADDFEVVLGTIGGDFGLQLLEFGSQAWIWREGKRVSRHVRLYLNQPPLLPRMNSETRGSRLTLPNLPLIFTEATDLKSIVWMI